MDTYSNNSSVISRAPPSYVSTDKGRSRSLVISPKIRFRYLSGTYTSNSQEATRSNSSIIWNGWGIGQSVFKYKAGISGYTIDLENTSIDLSYTFGDEYTLTLGSSAVSSGKLTIISSDSDIYNSSKVTSLGKSTQTKQRINLSSLHVNPLKF